MVTVFFGWCFLTTAFAAAQETVQFVKPETTDYETSEGTVHLAWQVAGREVGTTDLQFQIEQDSNPSFSTATHYYEGPENGTFVSGLPEGDFYYRVRAIDSAGTPGEWSSPALHVTVDYSPPMLVATLMIVGAIVFVSTVSVIIGGHRKALGGENSQPSAPK